MPAPVVDPSPVVPRELRFVVPLLAQDASYFAASAKIESFCCKSIGAGNVIAVTPSASELRENSSVAVQPALSPVFGDAEL